MGTDGILECKFLSKTRTVPPGLGPPYDGRGKSVVLDKPESGRSGSCAYVRKGMLSARASECNSGVGCL